MSFWGFVFGLAGIDICLKDRIEKEEAAAFPRELEGSNGKVTLYQNHNPGFSFGVLEGKPEMVKMVPLVLTSALGGAWGWLMMRDGKILEKTALSFAFAGALSNLYDRLTRGYVVDYVCIQYGNLKKVVFNLADLWILIGALLMVLGEFVDLFSGKTSGVSKQKSGKH